MKYWKNEALKKTLRDRVGSIMIIINFYEGFVSEIRAFFLGYRLARIHHDEMVMDLSQFYRGSFWSYHMDLLKIPEIKKISYRDVDVIKYIEQEYGRSVTVVENGVQLETIHRSYNKDDIYYIVNDSYFYDEFFMLHKEFFFRYIGDDAITQELYSMIDVKIQSGEYSAILKKIKAPDEFSVGVHIRLGDFFNLGWIVEEDFLFYRAAIQWFRDHEKDTMFYIFSDDIWMARRILGEADDIKYVHFTFSYQSDIEELLCLAECDGRILDKKSTYGLFAEAVAQNRLKKDGLTVIIKERHFQKDAGNKDYVEKATNTDNGVNKRVYFGNYKELGTDEIKEYSKKYTFKVPGETHCDDSHQELFNTTRGILFATRQTYVKAYPHGLQYFAHYLSGCSYRVGFIGKSINMCSEEENTACLEIVIDGATIESGMNSLESNIHLFAYTQLNKYKLYDAFYEKFRERFDLTSLVVIVRKPIALPPVEKHGDIVFVFIDFTDPFDEESKTCIKEYTSEEIKYMYSNADLVITFDKRIAEKCELKKKTYYIDLGNVYPLTMEPKSENSTQQLRNGMDNYCKEIMMIINGI